MTSLFGQFLVTYAQLQQLYMALQEQELKKLIKIIPSKFKIDKLLIYIDVDNVKSKFIPISLGFKKESEISQFEFYNGFYHDFEIYGLNVNESNIANG